VKSRLKKVTLTGPSSPITASYEFTQPVLLEPNADQHLGCDIVAVVTIGDATTVEAKLQSSDDGVNWVDHPSIGDVLEKQVSGDVTFVLKTGPLARRYVRAAVKATGGTPTSTFAGTLYYREAEYKELRSWAGDGSSQVVRSTGIVETSATSSDPIDCEKDKVLKDVGIDFDVNFTKGSLTNVAVKLQASYDDGTIWVDYPQGDGTEEETYTANTQRIFRTGPTIAGDFRMQWNASGTQTGSDLLIDAYYRLGK